MPKTKILCTIGPATWDKEILKDIIKNGMAVARINGAFADVTELDRVAKIIRSISKDVALMLDIKGTEVRLNKFKESLIIKKGDKVIIGSGREDKIYPVTYPDLYRDLKQGDNLVIDDGKVKLTVVDIQDKKIHTKVVEGNEISPGKSINTPGIALSNPALTEIDKEQMKFAVKDNWDFVAASFVRSKKDIEAVKSELKGSLIKIFAKVEDAQGIENIDEIIDVADGIIIARGDLGVEIPFEKIPMIQKKIITKCLLKAKPVVVATHMLESMIESPVATRAEINDVANAVFDGSDILWLSAESSKGKYPREAVKTLKQVAIEAEKYVLPEILDGEPEINPITVALAKGVLDIARSLPIDKIVVATGSGKTARIISSFRPKQPIIALTSNETYKRQLNATWGVKAMVMETVESDRDKAISKVVKKALEEKLLKKSDLILVVRGTTPSSQNTNSLEVGIVGEMINKLTD